MNQTPSQPRWNTDLKKGLASDNKPDANKVLFEAWQLTKEKRTGIGFGIIWSFLVVLLAVMFVTILVSALGIDIEENAAAEILISAIASIIWAPLMAGLILMALRNVTGENVGGSHVFALLQRPWVFIGISVVSMLIGQVPSFIPGVPELLALFVSLVILFFFSFALTIAVGTQCNVGNALYASVIIVKQRMSAFFVFYLALMFLAFVMVIPAVMFVAGFAAAGTVGQFIAIMLSLAVIYGLAFWLAPLFYHGLAVFYREIFGLKAAEAATSVYSNDETLDVNDASDDEASSAEKKSDRDNFQA